MGWVRKEPGKHSEIHCRKPHRAKETDFGLGSIWQCDDCGRHWLYEGDKENPYANSGDSREPMKIPVWTQCVAPAGNIGLYAPGSK